MRSAGHSGRGAIAVDDDRIVRRGPRLLRALGWGARDAVGAIVGMIAMILILINVLMLQPGPHPAPMVKTGVGPATTSAAAPAPAPASGMALANAGSAATTANLPRPRPVEALAQKAATPKAEVVKADRAKAEPRAPARPSAEIITDIQRELSRRGFYDGAADGRYGPKSDAAIRDFEQAAGLKPSTEPGEALLRTIVASPIKTKQVASAPAAAARPPAGLTRPDPIAEMLTPSKRVVAVQRALAEFGYGQINPSGIIDGETQAAIEKFERERKLPVTGQISHRVVRELAAITGRPLE